MGLIKQIQNEFDAFYREHGYPPKKIIFYDVEVIHDFMKEINESSVYCIPPEPEVSIYNKKFLGMDIVKKYKKDWELE